MRADTKTVRSKSKPCSVSQRCIPASETTSTKKMRFSSYLLNHVFLSRANVKPRTRNGQLVHHTKNTGCFSKQPVSLIWCREGGGEPPRGCRWRILSPLFAEPHRTAQKRRRSHNSLLSKTYPSLMPACRCTLRHRIRKPTCTRTCTSTPGIP